MTERIGILGGAFDPPHYGHLILAEQAYSQLDLNYVLFVPSYRPPEQHKSILTQFDRRCEMLEMALEDVDYFRISRIEEQLESPTYTVRMLEALKTETPDATFYFLMGSDSLEQLDSWYHPEQLRELADIAVARRPGYKRHVSPDSKQEVLWLEMPLIEISASDLRSRAQTERSLRFLVPDSVIEYIEEHELYRG